MARDLVRADRRDPGGEVVDLEHLHVRADLRVDGGEVGVQVEHARVGVPEEAEARPAQRAGDAGGADPGGDLPQARSSSSIVPATVS